MPDAWGWLIGSIDFKSSVLVGAGRELDLVLLSDTWGGLSDVCVLES